MNNYYIYILRCPDTNDIRYVGCTRFPTHRKREHCLHAIKEPKSRLQIWLKGLRDNTKQPIFEIIDTFKAETLAVWERGKEARWIQDYREQGCSLLNVHWNRYKG